MAVGPGCSWWVAITRINIPLDKMLMGYASEIGRLFPAGIRFRVHGITADGQRVAAQVDGSAQTPDGRRYDNTYHFLFEFADGRVRNVSEYPDSVLRRTRSRRGKADHTAEEGDRRGSTCHLAAR